MLALLSNPCVAAISAQDYVNQVLANQPALKAQKAQVEAATLDEAQTEVAKSYQLQSTLSSTVDKRPQDSLTNTYDSLTAHSLKTSLSRQFSTGTVAKLSVDLLQTSLDNVTISPQAPKKDLGFVKISPSIEVSQPLWQGKGGKTLSLQEKALRDQTGIQKSILEQRTRGLELAAKAAYYRLSFARDRVSIAKNTLETAEKIQSFVLSKQALNLLEKGDLLQSQALVAGRKLELDDAEMEEKAAALQFNSLRGEPSDSVPDELSSLKSTSVAQLEITPDLENRPEVKVAKAQIELAESSIKLSEDKVSPQLNAFSMHGFQSREDTFANSAKKINDPYYPVTTIGLTLSMTTDRDLVQASVNSAKAKKAASEYMLEDARRNLQSEVYGLLDKQKDAINLYNLAKSVEKIQKEKLDNEQKQHRNGRSTTYQLLMFSQDLALAELSRIKAAYNLQMIQAQLAQYKGEAK